MIVVMKPGASQQQIDHMIERIQQLGLRSQVIAELQKAGLRYGLAACTTDALIAKMGAGPLIALDGVTNNSDPRVVQVQRATRQAIAACQRSTTGSARI